MLGLVDWQLLVLFAGLFVVNHAMRTGAPATRSWHPRRGLDVAIRRAVRAHHLPPNVVSNVPAVMLLLPVARIRRRLGPRAGLDAGRQPVRRRQHRQHHRGRSARRLGVEIDWQAHARDGVPITLATLAIAAAWLALVG